MEALTWWTSQVSKERVLNNFQSTHLLATYQYHNTKLDESTTCPQLKSPWSISGRSIHLGHQMVMVMNDLLLPTLFNVNRPSHSEIQLFQNSNLVKGMCVVKCQGHIWPPKFKGQGHGQGQTHWSHLRSEVQSICSLFVSWQPDHFWLRYSKFHIWSWKFKVKVMAKVKSDGQIWGLEFDRYVCFSFFGNRTIFGWDIANSIFHLENSRWRSWQGSNPIVTFEAWSSIGMFAFRFVAIGHFWLRYSKFHIWPLKFKVKVTTKIDQNPTR